MEYPRRLRLFAIVCAALVLMIPLGCDYFSGERAINGTVIDHATNEPLPGAAVQAITEKGIEAQATANETGGFQLTGVSKEAVLKASADGYRSITHHNPAPEVTFALSPTAVNLSVLDSVSGAALANATANSQSGSVEQQQEGSFRIVRISEGSTITCSADGYAAAEVVFEGQEAIDISLRPNTLTGTVKSAQDGKPIEGAQVLAGELATTTDASGSYKLSGLPADQLEVQVSAAGYDGFSTSITDQAQLEISLEPFAVRAAYVTFFAAGEPSYMDNVEHLAETTELNSVVIDIKGDHGWIAYHSDVPLAEAIGANEVHTVSDIEGLLARLKQKGIYTIARIVTFKDNPLARNGGAAGLDVAIKDAGTGQPWIDGEDLGWVDPFREEVWDYNIALAKEAAQKGFDEIQFDYIRFPTDPSSDTSVDNTVYSRPNTEANRLEAVTGFMSKAYSALKPLGVNVSVDVFGYTCWREDDMGIGQKIETMGQYADFICPMVYPSTYSDGIPGYKDAVNYPYEIVYYSLEKAVERLAGLPAKIRPWLQYFDDYPWASGKAYNAAEVEAQIQATADSGAIGWQLWDPFVKYSRGGLGAE